MQTLTMQAVGVANQLAQWAWPKVLLAAVENVHTALHV